MLEEEEDCPLWIVCLAEKNTKKKLSELFVVSAFSIYKATEALEKRIGRKIANGEYADCLCVQGEEKLHWAYRYSV